MRNLLRSTAKPGFLPRVSQVAAGTVRFTIGPARRPRAGTLIRPHEVVYLGLGFPRRAIGPGPGFLFLPDSADDAAAYARLKGAVADAKRIAEAARPRLSVRIPSESGWSARADGADGYIFPSDDPAALPVDFLLLNIGIPCPFNTNVFRGDFLGLAYPDFAPGFGASADSLDRFGGRLTRVAARYWDLDGYGPAWADIFTFSGGHATLSGRASFSAKEYIFPRVDYLNGRGYDAAYLGDGSALTGDGIAGLIAAHYGFSLP